MTKPATFHRGGHTVASPVPVARRSAGAPKDSHGKRVAKAGGKLPAGGKVPAHRRAVHKDRK